MPAPRSISICDLTYTQQTIAADVMPNAIAGIATFTEANVQLPESIQLFKYPEILIESIQKKGIPDVIGFSNYIWNSSLSYAFATVIKRLKPDAIIVFGGPNYPVVPSEQEEWLRRWALVDFVILKEGELAFSRLVQALIDADGDVEAVKRQRIPSVHSVLSDGSAILTQEIDRIKDLTQIPSPYLLGRLDEFFDGRLLPIIQTNRGCPFSCTFCVEGVRYYNKVYRNSSEKISREIDYIGRKMQEACAAGGRNDLFVADSNFGMYPEDLDTCRALAKSRKLYRWPEYINVATGKNKKERVLEASRIIDGALRLSGSVQSLEPNVLENIKRSNISTEGLIDLGLQAGSIGANTYSEIIMGLPGSTKAGHIQTIKDVMGGGFTNIYLFQLMLLPGTELATNESKTRYEMVTRYRVLPRCYGEYELGSSDIIRSAEIEEICVATNTFSFEDYVDCRLLHLIITIFYNDSVFGSLLSLMRMLGVSPFRWLTLILEQQAPSRLRDLYKSFTDSTRSELWTNRAELENFIQREGTVGKFISGELGNNLLFVHKTRAISFLIEDLAAVAQPAMLLCLKEANKLDQDLELFIADALIYHQCRVANLFFKRDEAPEAVLHYDIAAFEAAVKPTSIADFLHPSPVRLSFMMEASQRDLIERFLSIYGDTPVGISRILSKVYLKKLYRTACSEREATMPPKVSSSNALLFGLQQ
jgi:radical SAM superfamily enzyme YgiQ (UPF0313 family)